MNFQDVEQARINYKQKYQKFFYGSLIITLVLAVATAFLLKIFTSSIQDIIFIGAIIIFSLSISVIVASITTKKQSEAYYKAYKAYFVEQNLKKTFTSLIYNHEKGIGSSYLRSTGMINTGDRFSSNDLTIAKYKDVMFLQSDAHIQIEQSDSEGNTNYVTIFKGRFMVFEFPKNFNFKLELIGKRFHAARVPAGKDRDNSRKMAKKSTESNEFNKAFRIYGQDDFESFYILDPAFMVKIMTISERYKNKLLLGFLNNNLLVALDDGKDSFEPPKFTKPIDEKAEMEKIHNDIKIITDFVDQLSLDKKLFK
jgi:hypothetical protein